MINDILDLINQVPGSATAIILPDTGTTVSYESLRAQVAAVADIFASIGIKPGDRVAMSLANGLDAIVCFLAATIAGTAAPLNPTYRPNEFDFYMDDTKAKVLVVSSHGGDDARRVAEERMIPVVTTEVVGGTVNLDTAARGKTAGPPNSDGIALVLHTSGSTGQPKRVPLRHRNLAASAKNIIDTYNLSSSDISLTTMPLFHVHGLVGSTLATLGSGGTVVLPEKFNPLSFWKTVREAGVTWYSAVPTIHKLLLSLLSGRKPQGAENLRFLRSCSVALPPDLMTSVEAAFGVPLLEAYGMTEASHQIASNPLPPKTRKPGAVGQGTGVQVGIMDTEGNLLQSGAAGEVVIQGPNVIDAYESNPEANAVSFTNGWFRTGDQGIVDSDGYLQLVARIKELINRGGEKVSPREVDEVLLAHPGIAEAVAFGVPHPAWGEEVAAAVVLKGDADEHEILSFCKERLAEFKRPKKIYIVENLPRTGTGKIQRRKVADVCTEATE